MKKTTMDFKQFDKIVKIYFPLNKDKSRYLILFEDNSFYFYSYDKKRKTFSLEKEV